MTNSNENLWKNLKDYKPYKQSFWTGIEVSTRKNNEWEDSKTLSSSVGFLPTAKTRSWEPISGDGYSDREDKATHYHQAVIKTLLDNVNPEGLASIPDLYEEDGKEPNTVKAQLCFWCPTTDATWWITERSTKDRNLFFGYVSIHEGFGELGYFRLEDIAGYCAHAGVTAILEDHTQSRGYSLGHVKAVVSKGHSVL
jgi:hypothetical protein